MVGTHFWPRSIRAHVEYVGQAQVVDAGAAWLEDLVVHRDWRARSIGWQLLKRAVAEARMAGCTRVTLLTDGDNDQAMRLYSRAGFVRSAMAPFRLSLRAG